MGNLNAKKVLLRCLEIALPVAFVVGLFSCGSTSTSSSSGGSTNLNPIPPSTSFPLSVQVSTTMDQSSVVADRGSCTIPVGSPTNTAITCSITVPELDMYYSSLNVGVGTDGASGCAQVVFTPYRYLKSNSSSYVNDLTNAGTSSANSIDCSIPASDAQCWGGAAVAMVTNFPTNLAMFFNTSSAASQTYTAPSAYTEYEGEPGSDSFYSNAWTANDLPAASRGTALAYGVSGGTDYVAGTYQDYKFQCLDDFGFILYQITMTITTSSASPNAPNPPAPECLPSSFGCIFWHWNHAN